MRTHSDHPRIESLAAWTAPGLVALVVACGGGGNAGPEPGFDTGPCISDACLGGLTCVDDVCVLPDEGSSGNGEASQEGSGETSSTDASTGASTLDTSTSDATASGSTSSVDDTTTDASSSSESGDTSDPNWPDPSLGCPDGFQFEDFDQAHDGGICMPPCRGRGSPCPEATTGDAVPHCGYNPLSSYTVCEDDSDCVVATETCEDTGSGFECLLPPVWCNLYCGFGNTCPETMVCTDSGWCEWD